MMRIHIRIRPRQSPADLHPELIEKHLSLLQNIEIERVIDDRVDSGMTVTLVLSVTEPSTTTLSKLQQALLKLPKVTVSIMDKSGNETDLSAIKVEQISTFAIM